MSAELAINSGVHSAMPTALMLLLALAVSTLASYVALDLARRVRVLRTRAGALWLFGAASAMALGIWSSQVIGIAAEPLAFPFGYDGIGTLGVWTAALVASLAGLGAVSGRVATPDGSASAPSRSASARSARMPSASRRSGCSPGSSGSCCRWSPPSPGRPAAA